MQTKLDCNQFTGRKRDICRGHDDAGNPVLTPEKCEAYRRLWAGLPPEKPRVCGPGCQLKRLLSWLNLTDDGNCNCSEHAAEMDRRGPDWCAANVDLIVDWMEEAAAERGLHFSRFAASRVVHLAIRLARHSIAQAKKAGKKNA